MIGYDSMISSHWRGKSKRKLASNSNGLHELSCWVQWTNKSFDKTIIIDILNFAKQTMELSPWRLQVYLFMSLYFYYLLEINRFLYTVFLLAFEIWFNFIAEHTPKQAKNRLKKSIHVHTRHKCQFMLWKFCNQTEVECWLFRFLICARQQNWNILKRIAFRFSADAVKTFIQIDRSCGHGLFFFSFLMLFIFNSSLSWVEKFAWKLYSRFIWNGIKRVKKEILFRNIRSAALTTVNFVVFSILKFLKIYSFHSSYTVHSLLNSIECIELDILFIFYLSSHQFKQDSDNIYGMCSVFVVEHDACNI